MIENWASVPSYARAKLYNILFARELARRGAAEGIIAHAMHPGIVDSNFTSHGNAQMQAHMATAVLDPPERSAATLAWLASAPEPGQSSGRYWFDKAQAEPTAAAQNDDDARKLWEVSERLIEKAGV
jgi:NAD(P)-dependent dehydrogenase (short-subunit alcohol dehydrogenase family)